MPKVTELYARAETAGVYVRQKPDETPCRGEGEFHDELA